MLIMFAMLAPILGLLVPGTLSATSPSLNARNNHYDVLIYGATPGGIAAAIQVTRMSRSVAIVCPQTHVGGMSTSGLGWTDSKNGSAIGGIARQFYQDIYEYYLSDSAWTQVNRTWFAENAQVSQPGPQIEIDRKVQWTFEPHVAEYVYEKWLQDANIPVFRNEWLDQESGVQKDDNGAITAITMCSGNTYTASMFIDADYNGDLMDAAGIPWRAGREASSEYNESLAGVQYPVGDTYRGIDPYNTPGDNSSGLIAEIQRTIDDPGTINGTADPVRLQAYNYRVSLTQVPELKIDFYQPDGYDEAQYEILFRYVESGYRGQFFTQQVTENLKTDSNANSSVSTDLLGGVFNATDGTNYATWSYERRQVADAAHKSWMQGFFWTLAYHPRIAEEVRNDTSKWGYTNDEWTDNGNWPYELYIRESRRMNGSYTVSQRDVQNSDVSRFDGDAIVGLGSYTMDVHIAERAVTDGKIQPEGLVHTPVPQPYPLPYGSLVPPKGGCPNFLNPITLSATHVAFASIRLEPTYMILGQSAATAAVLALEDGVAVQDVNRTKLTERLLADNQFLEWPSPVV